MKRYIQKYIQVALFLGVIGLLGHVFMQSDVLNMIVAHSEANKLAGFLLFVFLYWFCGTFLLPVTPFTILIGTIFQPLHAIGAIIISSVLGAISAFCISRKFGQQYLHKRFSKNKYFNQVNVYFEQQGYLPLFLIRSLPIFPYSLVSHACGLSKIHFGGFVVASAIGMIPSTLLFLYLGKSIAEFNILTLLLIIVGLSFILVLSQYIKNRKT